MYRKDDSNVDKKQYLIKKPPRKSGNKVIDMLWRVPFPGELPYKDYHYT